MAQVGTLKLVTAPALAPVSLLEAKSYLRVESDDDDALISDLIDDATRRLDGPNGLLGQCLLNQVWELALAWFTSPITIPLGPCQAVQSLTFHDTTGPAVLVDPASYQVFGIGSDDDVTLQVITGLAWPNAAWPSHAVEVRFIAGFGNAPSDVPAPIRTAIKMRVATLYGTREGTPDTDGIDHMLTNYRRVSL